MRLGLLEESLQTREVQVPPRVESLSSVHENLPSTLRRESLDDQGSIHILLEASRGRRVPEGLDGFLRKSGFREGLLSIGSW